MILVQLNTDRYEYDIHSLVKAFYPHMRVIFQPSQAKDSEEISFSLAINIQADHMVIEGESYDIDTSDMSIARNTIKKALYLYLSKRTNKTLPWGTLTGVRPTKRPMEQLLVGKSQEQAIEDMEQMYFTSHEKAALATRVAQRELQVLSTLPLEKSYSLYIGIPFCPTRCLYCSFTSYGAKDYLDQMDAYVDCLLKELDAIAQQMKDYHLITIYMGGGTPTSLSPIQLERILQGIQERFDLSDVAEICVEAGRPDSITREKLEVLKAYGVTRISINPQTMQQKTLDLIGRKHTVAQVMDSFAMARKAGFDHINMDLIVGLPGERIEDVTDTLRQVRLLEPEGLTVHSLAIKRAARLNIEKEDYQDLYYDTSAEMMDACALAARDMGLSPYYMYRQKNISGNMENVAYCKKGQEGLYNILMMEDIHSIVAAGAGAISKMILGQGKILRAANVKDVKTYFERIDDMIEKKGKAIQQWKAAYNMEEE